jgi:AcrR family transcriptional regulator
MFEVVAKRGYGGTTVEHIVKRAGLSRATFYESFENREDCLLAGFDAAREDLERRILAAIDAETRWPDQVRAGIEALLGSVAAEPVVARTCLVEATTAGPKGLQRYEEALQRAAVLFRAGRSLSTEDEELPQTLEDSIVGGIVWMIHQRLLRGEAEKVPALLPTMVEFALSPYLGHELAVEYASA